MGKLITSALIDFDNPNTQGNEDEYQHDKPHAPGTMEVQSVFENALSSRRRHLNKQIIPSFNHDVEHRRLLTKLCGKGAVVSRAHHILMGRRDSSAKVMRRTMPEN